MQDLKAVKDLVSKDLLDLCKKVKKLLPSHDPINRTISFKNILSLKKFNEFFKDLNLPKNARYIYILKFKNLAQAKKAKFLYLTAKKENKYAFSRYNNPQQNSCAFYVGSSKNIKARLKQHFGLGSASARNIYSLQMDTWTKNLNGEFLIQIICFDADISPEVLQIIEDTYSKKFNPIFGKRGSV